MHFWKQLLLKSATSSAQTSASGKMWTWGQGTLGQLGLSGIFSIAQVSSGGSHRTAITSDGRIFTWGLNAQGQLGTGDTLNRSSPTQVGGNFSWLAVSAGDKYTLAIRNDGGLFAWGDNSQGQLGLNLGTVTRFFRPTQVGISSWTAISAGDFHAVAIDSTNKLYAWGLNDVGQLGIGTDTFNRSSPIAIGSSSWTFVGLGSSHSMAIRSDGGLFGWGRNNVGQLGLSDTNNRSSPVQLGTSSWTLVSAGNNHTLAIRSGGTLWAWGNGTNFELGQGTTLAQSRSSPTQIGLLATWSRIGAGINFSFGTLTTGALFAWGLNTSSQLGTNDAITRSSPTQIGVLSWTAISASRSIPTAAGATIAAGLYGWGVNTNGIAGDGTTINKATPTALIYTTSILTQTPWMVGNSSWSLVAAGFNTTFGTLSTNTLYAWGTNTTGGLGVGAAGDTFNRSSPTQIGTSSWLAISASERSQHAVAIRSDRTLWVWGNNASGQLGDNTTINKSIPTQITFGTSSWSQVNAGGSVTAGITIAGTLFTWGANTNFQLGDNTSVGKSSPTLIPGSWSQVSIGASHVLALRSNNTLWAWGINTNGQLGLGDTITRSNPVQINYSSWQQVSAGQDHSLAIAADGSLWGWGNNTSGQAGVLTESRSWAQIAQGNSFTVAKRSDGTIWSWGLNDTGQLGTSNYNLKGDTYNRSSPVQIGTSSWSQVFVSLNTGFAGAIDPNGALWAWGLNTSGQLGVGDLINRSSPVQVTQVTSPNSWISVDGGNDFIVGVTSDKKLWGWGSTAGLNIALPSFSWSQVSGQGAHTLAIRNDGKLFAWGLNSAGQLGTGDTLNRSSPVQIGFSSWSLVDAGLSHSMAVDRFGVLYAWGLNSSAQLGTSDFISRSSPTQVTAQSWFAISAGDTHSTGISNKLLYTWGAGAQGQLGELTDSLSWSTVSAGVNGVIGIAGGALFGWGLNTSGKLGINDTFNRSSPVQIGSNRWTSVAAYGDSMIALDANNLAYVWGNNSTGQLGLGKVFNRSNPTQINAQQPTDTSGYRDVNVFRTFGNPIVSTSVVPFRGTYSGGFNLSQSPAGTAIADGLIDRVQINSSSNVPTVSGLIPTPGSYFIPYASLTATAQPTTAGSTLDFTWEAWIFPTAFTVSGSNGRVIMSYGAEDVTLRLSQQANDAIPTTSVAIVITNAAAAQTTLTAGGTVYKNRWQHIALCRQSGVFNVWVDGARVINDATQTATALRTNGSYMFSIGQGNTNNGNNADYFVGYISNVRVVNTLAVYTTATFNPPSSTLQATQIANANGVPSAAITAGLTSLLTYTTERSILGGVSYTQVAAGNSYMMALDTTGKLFTWGLNNLGQLGVNDTINRSMPVQIQQYQAPLGGSWTSISAGSSAAAAITSNGRLFTWGDNTNGLLGQTTTGTAFNRSSPTQIGSSSWTQVVVGTSHALAIRVDRTLWAWGANSIGATATGQLGNSLSETVARSIPVQIGLSSWTQVAVGDTHTLAIRLDGTLWSWGRNGAGELGLSLAVGASRSSPVQIGTSSWSQVAAGVSLSVARDITGNVYVWGLNNIGQLGLSDTFNRSSPTLLGNILPQFYASPNQVGTSNWLSVSAGTNFTLGLALDRTMYGWGLNSSYQLGDNTTITRSLPVQIGNANSWSVIDAGSTHSGAITTLGQLYMWGTNAAGLGVVAGGDTILRSSPTLVSGTTSWISVDAGVSHTSAIDTNYQLWVWGTNAQGQLGQNTTGTAGNRSSPTLVGTSSWSLVYAGTNATYGIDVTGKLFAWGLNSSGETGVLTAINRSSPTQIGTILAAGNLSIPTELSTLSSWSLVDAGLSITAAIASNASLWTWGLNSVGQLGTGDTITRSSPTQIGVLSWSMVDAGGNHMLGLTTNKLLYVWGGGAAGQLGRGNTTNLSTPSLLPGIYATTSFSSVSAGISYSMATEIDGDLYAWGLNTSGQLGDGTTVNKSTPVIINSVGVPTTFYDRSVYNTSALTFTRIGSPVIASDNPYGGDYGDTSAYGGSFYGPTGADALQGPIPASTGLYQFNLIGDFTIEGWVKLSGTNSNTGYVAPILTNDDGNYPGFFSLGIQDSSGRISVDIPGIGVQFTGSALVYDRWYHLAMVRSKTAGTISVYLDGTLNTPVSGSNPFTAYATNDILITGTGPNSNIFIGKMPSQDAYINGFIHAVRLTGKAVYTGNFTVPIVPYGITNPASTNIAAVNSTDVKFLGCCELTPFIGKSFVQVSAGPTNGGAISDTGRALVWGTGNVGQTAEIFSTVNRSFITQVGVIYPLQSVINTPTAISQRSNWTAVSAGSGYSMAIRGDGKLFAWGQNFAAGLLGTGDTITRSSPVQIGTNNWRAIETGVSHVAGITSS